MSDNHSKDATDRLAVRALKAATGLKSDDAALAYVQLQQLGFTITKEFSGDTGWMPPSIAKRLPTVNTGTPPALANRKPFYRDDDKQFLPRPMDEAMMESWEQDATNHIQLMIPGGINWTMMVRSLIFEVRKLRAEKDNK
jgi:hypothetical protein